MFIRLGSANRRNITGNLCILKNMGIGPGILDAAGRGDLEDLNISEPGRENFNSQRTGVWK